jgi:hypothetical protein
LTPDLPAVDGADGPWSVDQEANTDQKGKNPGPEQPCVLLLLVETYYKHADKEPKCRGADTYLGKEALPGKATAMNNFGDVLPSDRDPATTVKNDLSIVAHTGHLAEGFNVPELSAQLIVKNE